MSEEGIKIMPENTVFSPPEADPLAGKSKEDLYAHGNDLLSEMRAANRDRDKERIDELKKKFQEVQRLANTSAATEAPMETPVAPTPTESITAPETPEALVKVTEEGAKKEAESIPEADKESVALGLQTAGHLFEEFTGRKMADIVGFAAKTNLNENSRVSNWLKELQGSYTREADAAKLKGEDAERTSWDQTKSLTVLGVNMYKLARPLIGSTANPFRWLTVAGAFIGRNADAYKEAVLKEEDVIDKTRIDDINKASDEAYNIYLKAAGGDEEAQVSADALKHSYLTEMPKDLLARLQAERPEQTAQEKVKASIDPSLEPSAARLLVEGIVKKDIAGAIQRLENRINKIDADTSLTPEQKEFKKQKELNKQADNLRDYDRIIGEYGTVSMMAMAGRWAKTAGKGLIYGSMVHGLEVGVSKFWPSMKVGASKLWSGVSEMLAHNHAEVGAIQAAGVRDALAHVAPGPHPGEAGDFDKLFPHPEPMTPEMQEFMKNPLNNPFFPHAAVAHVETALPGTQDVKIEDLKHSFIPTAKVPDVPPHALDITAMPSHEIDGIEGGNIEAAHAAEVVDNTTETIHKGSSVTNTIDQMVKSGKITVEQAHIARNNPLSGGLVGGHETNIDKLWLSHEGDQIKFVPGAHGEAPRFDVIEGTHGHLGTQADLEAAKIADGVVKKAAESIPHTVPAPEFHPVPTPELHSVPLPPETVDDALNQITDPSSAELAQRVAEMNPSPEEMGMSLSEFMHNHGALADTYAQTHEHASAAASAAASVPEHAPSIMQSGEATSGALKLAESNPDNVTSTSFDGDYKFTYDKGGNPMSILLEGRAMGITGNEFLKSGAALKNPDAYTSLANENRVLIPEMKLFEKFSADPSKKKETSFLLEVIRNSFKTMRDKYGREAFDDTKMPIYIKDMFAKRGFLASLFS